MAERRFCHVVVLVVVVVVRRAQSEGKTKDARESGWWWWAESAQLQESAQLSVEEGANCSRQHGHDEASISAGLRLEPAIV